jgi:hypothetical protein
MKKVSILIILVVILLVLIIGWLALRGYQIKKATVTTYKTEYSEGENPRIKIENHTGERICFSSCYPYYLEKNNGKGFASYKYDDCQETDIVQTCIEPAQIKAFELLLEDMRLDKGAHRVAVPACVGCVFQEKFRKDEWFYSNEFIIK